MGFDTLVDCSSFVSSAIGQVGVSAGQVSHAIGELTKAMGACSHAEGYNSKASGECSRAEGSRGMRRNHIIIEDTEIPPTTISSLFEKKPVKIGVDKIVKMSIVRKSSLPERQTTTLTVDNAKINWDIFEKNFGLFNQGDIVFHR